VGRYSLRVSHRFFENDARDRSSSMCLFFVLVEATGIGIANDRINLVGAQFVDRFTITGRVVYILYTVSMLVHFASPIFHFFLRHA
jgi:hypothetical protein